MYIIYNYPFISTQRQDDTTVDSGTLSHAAFLRILGFTAGNPRMDLTHKSTSARVVRGWRVEQMVRRNGDSYHSLILIIIIIHVIDSVVIGDELKGRSND